MFFNLNNSDYLFYMRKESVYASVFIITLVYCVNYFIVSFSSSYKEDKDKNKEEYNTKTSNEFDSDLILQELNKLNDNNEDEDIKYEDIEDEDIEDEDIENEDIENEDIEDEDIEDIKYVEDEDKYEGDVKIQSQIGKLLIKRDDLINLQDQLSNIKNMLEDIKYKITIKNNDTFILTDSTST